MKFFLLLALPAFLSSALLFFFLTQNNGGGGLCIKSVENISTVYYMTNKTVLKNNTSKNI